MPRGSANASDARSTTGVAKYATHLVHWAGRVGRSFPDILRLPIRRLVRQLYGRRLLLRPTWVRGSRMLFGLAPADIDRYFVAATAMISGNHEPMTSGLVERVLKPGMVVVDVGAHVGYYSLLSSRLVGIKGHVFAFEPEPGNYRVLTRNVELNAAKNVTPANKAISGTNGRLPFHISGDSGSHSIIENRNASDKVIEVESLTLDRFMEQRGVARISLLKLDAEGAEPGILAGAERTLEVTDRIIMEYLPENLREARMDPLRFVQQVDALAARYGFSTHILDDERDQVYSRDGLDLAALTKELERDPSRNYVYFYLTKDATDRVSPARDRGPAVSTRAPPSLLGLRVLEFTLWPAVGGLERMLLELSAGLRGRGAEVEIVFLTRDTRPFPSMEDEFSARGLEIRDLGTGFGVVRILRAARRLATEIRRFRPDVVHTHSARADFVAALAKRMAGGPPLVTTIHGPLYGINRWFGWATRRGLRWAFRRADRLVAVSDSARTDIDAKIGLRGQRMAVIHPGIRAVLPISRVALAATAPSAYREPRIGTHGRMGASKDLSSLIRAMAHVVREAPTASLQLAGYDQDGQAALLHTQAEALGLADRVQFVGYMPDLAKFLESLDVFVFAGAVEGLPVAVLEAMQAGLPVVAFDSRPIREVVEHGQTGYLVPPGDDRAFAKAVARLLRDHGLARRLGEAARLKVGERFAATRMVEEYSHLFLSVVGRNGVVP